jgi:hypothetical protein
MAKPPAGYTDEMRSQDSALLSAALGAVARGVKAGETSTEITSTLASVRMSRESFQRLWPSKTYLKEYTLKKGARFGKVVPKVKEVEGSYAIFTPLRPTLTQVQREELTGNPEKFHNVSVPLMCVEFHQEAVQPPGPSKALIQDFIGGISNDYRSIQQYLHIVDGRFCLYWLTFALSGLSWADEEDGDTQITIGSSPTPKKKRKRNLTN